MVKAEEAEENYKVYDAAGEAEAESFADYYSALRFYNSVISDYGNAVLKENDDVLRMEYGVVELKRDDACSLRLDYESSARGETGHLNGCYGIDALYLSSSRDASVVYFRISGDEGSIRKENVILHPYEETETILSTYSVSGGSFYHDIKNRFSSDYYAYSVLLDQLPEGLKEGKRYFSYDGHYFYEDFALMAEDAQNGVYDQAVNAEEPYYNYYQYLSHRTTSAYEASDVEAYFRDVLHIDGKLRSYHDKSRDGANDEVNRSQYYGELRAFFEYQYLYGANALMMLSLSISESSYGKSARAFLQNNLFRHAAYDSDQERYASRYDSVEDSIYSHAKYYISDIYSNHRRSSYHGAFFGNKACGMNVEYADDPYWGEKAASWYYRLDEALGFKDRNIRAVGIISSIARLNVYADEGQSSRLFTLRGIDDYAFVLLEDCGNVYKVQVEPSFDDEYLYDFERCVGYVRKDVFDVILNEEKIHEEEYVPVHFDLDGGTLAGKEELTLKVVKGMTPAVSDPEKDRSLFAGFDKELVPAEKETTYTATYRGIQDVSLTSPFPKQLEIDQPYDLSSLYLDVYLDDGSEEKVEVTTDMISSLDTSVEGEQEGIINYHGITLSFSTEVSSALKEERNQIRETIDRTMNTYLQKGTFDKKDVLYLKEKMNTENVLLAFAEIRDLDRMYMTDHDFNLHLEESERDLGISGLSMAVNDDNEREFRFIHDTYYLLEEEIPEESRTRLEAVSGGYGFEVVDAFRLSLKKNYHESDIYKPVIIQIRVRDKSQERAYSVYHLDEDGNVIKLQTTQSNSYIQFRTDELGDFMILSIGSANTYDIPDRDENISQRSDVYDNHLFVRNGLLLCALSLAGTLCTLVYYLLERKKEREWKDFRKSLQNGDTVPAAKLKN